jgi:origin recognition complex subunit 3
MCIFPLQVVLTSTCPFQLDDKTFKLLTDIFLFYDFSVYGFIQHYKVSILVLNVCGPFCIINTFTAGYLNAQRR